MKFLIILYVAITVVLCVVLAWGWYVYNLRYSSERVAAKIFAKHQGTTPSGQFAEAVNGKYINGKATADIIYRSTTNGSTISTVPVTLPDLETCSVINPTCVRL